MTALASQLPPHEPLWRLSVAQYHEMIEHGILTPDDPIELIDGLLITKMSKNPPHVVAAKLAADKIDSLKPVGWHVRRQDPITTDDSEPGPDVVLAKGDTRDYDTRHPGPADIAVVIEVADSTLDRDRTLKLVAYARASIRVYWLVNLVDRIVEVFNDPSGSGAKAGYQRHETFLDGDSVPLLIEGEQIAMIPVRDLLP